MAEAAASAASSAPAAASAAASAPGAAAAAAASARLAGLRAGLNLFRRLPPCDGPRTLSALVALCPPLAEDFLQRCDVPPQARLCAASGKQYLLCDYNRDGDSYRSPFSNAGA